MCEAVGHVFAGRPCFLPPPTANNLRFLRDRLGLAQSRREEQKEAVIFFSETHREDRGAYELIASREGALRLDSSGKFWFERKMKERS